MEKLIDLQQFCYDGACRYEFDKPFVKDGFVYATDMIICVRIPSEEKNTEGRFPKDMLFAFKCATSDPIIEPWPTEFINEIAECPECDGSGKFEIECTNCNGSGHDECPHCCGDMDCEECDGDGFTEDGECEVCHGDCQFKQDIEQVVGGMFIAAKYGKMILTLPNVRYQQPKDTHSIYFTFDGGDGVVAYLDKGR